MKTNPLKKGEIMINSVGIGTVTRKMVRNRAVRLAKLDGRSAQDVSKADWETAMRELTGGPEMDPKEAALEAAPESERWDPVPGSEGHKVSESPGEDEDDEGRSDNERLVEEGIEEAELDQMIQATRAAGRKDERRNRTRKRPSKGGMKSSIPQTTQMSPSSSVDTSAGVEPSVQELVRRRAYELFEARGRKSGHDVEDWLQAEREVKQYSARLNRVAQPPG
jgi:hypothetical protein